jgi:hypothetical protein
MARQAEVQGLDNLSAQLSKLGKLGDKAVTPALMAGGEVLADSVRDQIQARDLIDTKALYNSVHVQKVGPREVHMIEGPLPYVFAQEFGLPRQRITDRQRRFFWAKFAETKEDMWKALALSTTYTIPASPHFRPGVRNAERKAAQVIADETASIILGGI